jgi:ubiquinone/menaquinone biosynthesis C-methylase UbiE
MDKHEKRSMAAYNKKADHYDDTFDGKFTLQFKEQLLKTVNIPEGGRVLDVACGNGRLLHMLSQTHNFFGYGTDISEKMIENSKALNPSMVFECAPCDKLPFEDGFFDVITVCAAFHHFPDVEGFAKEAERVLKAGGLLYVAEVYYRGLLRAVFNPFIKLSRDGDVKFYSPEEIVRLLELNGFSKEVIKKEGHVQIIGVHRKG